jgi:hypothetical protein
MVSRIGSSKEKGKLLKNDVGGNTRSFPHANICLYIWKQDEIDFISKTKMTFYFILKEESKILGAS